MKTAHLKHSFVESIPHQIEEGILYISIEYCTAIHKCVCGCGNEVVTPLSPTDWELSFDGETVSLDPSIGNWNYPCQSHYWIRKGKVSHAMKWSKSRIEFGRSTDRKKKNEFYSDKENENV